MYVILCCRWDVNSDKSFCMTCKHYWIYIWTIFGNQQSRILIKSRDDQMIPSKERNIVNKPSTHWLSECSLLACSHWQIDNSEVRCHRQIDSRWWTVWMVAVAENVQSVNQVQVNYRFMYKFHLVCISSSYGSQPDTNKSLSTPVKTDQHL